MLKRTSSVCPRLQIMSLHLRYVSFLWQVADLGCSLAMPLLRDGARLLMKLMPPHAHVHTHTHIVAVHAYGRFC